MTLYDQIKQIFDGYGVPPWIWYPIAIAESGGRPNAVNHEANGTWSFGLFQLNSGGQGAGYTPAQLADPLENARIAAPAIANAWNQIKSNGQDATTQLTEVMQQSGHGGAVSIALNALSNFLHRGSLPAPEFGGIFKNGFFPGISIPMLGIGAQMIEAILWGGGAGGIPSYASSGGGTITFPGGSITLPNPLQPLWDFFATFDWTRWGIGVIGFVLILIAIVAFLWKPTVQLAETTAKAAAVTAA